MNRLLWQMFAGTCGGYKRGYILKCLTDKPCNVNQIACILNIDYKTTRHHLHVLVKNGMITARGDKYGKKYFLSTYMAANLDNFNQIWKKITS